MNVAEAYREARELAASGQPKSRIVDVLLGYCGLYPDLLWGFARQAIHKVATDVYRRNVKDSGLSPRQPLDQATLWADWADGFQGIAIMRAYRKKAASWVAHDVLYARILAVVEPFAENADVSGMGFLAMCRAAGVAEQDIAALAA